MFKVVSKAVIALISTTSAAANPGFGGSITADGLNNAKNVIAPFIFKSLADIKIPEIDISGGKFTNLDIKIPQPDLSNVNMILDNAKNGIELNAKGISTAMTAAFEFKYIITVDGTADINVKNMLVDVELALGTQPGTPGSDLAPKLTVVKTNININPDDVDIQLHGGLVSKIANVLVPLIKSSLLPAIVTQIEDTVKELVENTIDADLAKYGSQITIPYLAGVTFDFGQYNNGPQVTKDSVLELSMNGTFFDIKKPESFAITPAVWPLRNPSGKTLQMYLTDYVVNTNLIAAFDTGNTLDITTLLQKFLNITVTTDNLGLAVPEILKKYGSGKPVAISGAFVTKPGAASFSNDVNTLDLNLAVTIKVDNEIAIQGQFDGISVAAILNSKNGKIFGEVSKTSICTLSNFKTSLGMTAAVFHAELQGLITAEATTLNTALAAGLVIPTVFGINVSDVEINTHPGYFEFGINATPATFLDIQDTWVAYKAEYDNILAGAFKTEKYFVTEPETLFLQ
jgi:hypothetical protein